jgi:putative transposase
MKRSRFTEEQIIGILKGHEAGVSVADLCRKHGVSDASIYKWKAKFGGMDVSEAKRLRTGGREHTAEATPGRRHAGQRSAEGPLGKEVVTPAGNRKAVVHLREAFGMSERRACKNIGCCRMTMRYRTTRWVTANEPQGAVFQFTLPSERDESVRAARAMIGPGPSMAPRVPKRHSR